jgi:hypothetical protein
LYKFSVYEGVSFVTNDKNEKVAVQIDLKILARYDEDVEDLLDGIIAESRKDEKKVPLEEVIKGLKKAGKLK